MRQPSCVSKRINNLLFRFAYPTTIVRVFPIVDRVPANSGRLTFRMRSDNRLRNLGRQPLRIRFVQSRSQASHGRGRRVSVRC